jgi:methionyl-tRNA synthetase
MPQFEFYINDSERKEIVNHILLKKTKIIPDKLYPSERYETLKTENELIDNLNEGYVRYFLIDESYEIEDLDFLDIDFEDGVKYKISQRIGGPYIDLVFYLGNSEDATIKYKSSSIDYYAKFIHRSSSDEFKATEELKQYYKEIVKFIKIKCTTIKKNGKTYWISNEVLKELEI